MASVEEILLLSLGLRGRWQWKIFWVNIISGTFNGLHALAVVFLAATPDHWCSIPEAPSNWTMEQVKQRFIPQEEHEGQMRFSRCRRFLPMNSSSNPLMMNVTQACDQWTFNKTEYPNTVTIQWELVCQYEYLSSTIQATYMAGIFAGNFFFNTLSDRFGRRPLLLSSVTLYIVSTICTAFAPNYMAFVMFRFLGAAAGTGNFILGYVIVTEICVSPKRRSLLGIIYSIPFSIGYVVFPGIAYFIRDWSKLQLCISIPSIVFFIYYKFIPESPRWLITQGRFLEALKILKEGAKVNGVMFPEEEQLLVLMQAVKSRERKLKNEMKKNGNQCLIGNLCSTKEMIKRVCITYFTWFTVSMVYYGLALHVPKISSNKYLVFCLSGVVEIPAYIASYYVMKRWGRRLPYSISFILAGMFCLATVINPQGLSWFPVASAIFGKLIVTATFGITYLYTAELFPTVVRAIAVGYGSMCARVGSMIAPYIVDLLGNFHSSIPVAVFGALSIISGLSSLLLPETHNTQLSETVIDTVQPELVVPVDLNKESITAEEQPL